MTVLLWIVGGLAALLLVLFAVGLALPERYEARVRLALSASPEAVWEALGDARRVPMTGRMCRGVEPLPDADGGPRWVEDMGSTRITVTTLEADAPRRVVRRMEDSVVPMTARTELLIEPAEGGSLLTATTEIVVRRGTWHVPLFRLTLTCFDGARRGLADTLARLAGALGVEPRFLDAGA